MDPHFEKIIESINEVFYFVFVIELIFKLIGLGFASYFRDQSNIFDFIIVVLSTVDVVISAVTSGGQRGERQESESN